MQVKMRRAAQSYDARFDCIAPTMSAPFENNAPHPVDAPRQWPSRKDLREILIPLSRKSTLPALGLLALDWLVWLALCLGTVWFDAWWAKLLCGLALGFQTGRLFIIGHDACHQSLTPHRGLNKWLGRMAFLPSLTPYSLWDVGHNLVHHGYTNLKGFDFVWAPATQDEYASMSAGRRALERIYRSGWGPGLYYLVEIWWLRMFFPSKTYMGTRRASFLWDNLLVTGFAVLWLGGLAWGAATTNQSLWLVWLCGFVVPFLFWCHMIGFVVYVHHTHIRVSWHDDKAEWSKAQPFVSTTVHLTFPLRIGALMHHIMEHTAHHVDMSIPLYRLKQAQAKLEDLMPGRIIVQPFSWHWYFSTARLCKLYDFKLATWTDFRGRPTRAVSA
jgi:acyl-lipid omega-6 desaturase (Delta-12 desaturase)